MNVIFANLPRAAVLALGLSAAVCGIARADTVGLASFYGSELHGRKTASGERFNKNALTAAHRAYPFGTTLRVTNLSNNRSVVVRVNDRGPFVRKRIIDVSYAAARSIGMVGRGVARVRVSRL
jgi:rare lipoprotein A